VGVGAGAGKIPEGKDIEIFPKSREDGRINPITNIFIYMGVVLRLWNCAEGQGEEIICTE
jgi:hypothetical protein